MDEAGGVSRVKSNFNESSAPSSSQIPFVNGDDLRLIPAVDDKRRKKTFF